MTKFFLQWIEISVIAFAMTSVKLPLFQKLFYRSWRSATGHFIYSAILLLLPCLLIPTLCWLKLDTGVVAPDENEAFKALFAFLILIQGFLLDLYLIARGRSESPGSPNEMLGSIFKSPRTVIYTLATNFFITLALLGLLGSTKVLY
ncbi:MAG: hypothetical protein H6677_17345 [Candidatus Obscuribacterales bacterium]|nr:hypothetical protein [Cyanobacteria bacterium HKST-UBA01]MCB9470040.1 hypothetical protein [Candidatus Obscuribacterales bacterium]